MDASAGPKSEPFAQGDPSRKRLIRTLRFLLLLGVMGLAFSEAREKTLPWQFWLAAGLYFASNVVYHFDRADIFKSFRLSALLFLFDGAVLTCMMVLLGGGSNVFYVLLAVTLLISAVSRSVGGTLATTVAVGVLYTLLSVNGVAGVESFGSTAFLVHVALFFILSLFVAYFAREADRVRNAARMRLDVERDQREALEVLVRERTEAVETRSAELQAKAAELEAKTEELQATVQRLERAEQAIRQSREELIGRLAMAAEFRDDETPQHLQRMSAYCELIARKLDLDADRCDLIRVASTMHDIGKIGIPENILLKQEALTSHEAETLKRHTEIGHRILAGSETDLLQVAAIIAWTHHERLDGRGYPRGLRAQAIPLEGRVAAVADEFDTLTSKRAHRDLVPVAEAFGILRDGAGVLYDRDVVQAFLSARNEVQEIRAHFLDQYEGSKARLRAILLEEPGKAHPEDE